MARVEGRVAEVARAILDGTPVDWAAAASRADRSERRLLDQLTLLAAVAHAHRDRRTRYPLTSAGETADAARLRSEPPEQWGHLRILEPIGHGAFGDVYRAWDPRLDREVALKLLPASPLRGEAHASSIIEEGRLLARVRHPNVVTIYGADRIAGRIGLWMELIEGQTLEEMLRQRAPIAAAEVVRIGIELAHAVSAVHAAGLLHRDIKAQNVILAADGRIVLMDFGTGREVQGESHAGLAGTPLYLAPELLAGHAATVESDIYSLGVLLFHLLTGSYPVRAATVDDLRGAHARRAPAQLRTMRAGVPGRLARIIQRAIHPELDRRYESAGALADALEALRGGSWLRPAAVTTLISLGVWGAWELHVRQSDGATTMSGMERTPPRMPATVPDTYTSPRSIAVLPFKPFAAEDADEALQLGITEAVIHQLSRIGTLRIEPLARVRRFGATDQDPLEAGRTLGVEAVLEGHFQQTNSRVQVRWRLLSTREGSALAAHEWHEPFDNILQVQSRVPASLVQALEIALTREERERISRSDTENLLANAEMRPRPNV